MSTQVQPPADEVGSSGSLADRAYAQVKDKLILLDIRPGEPINDLALARELGVGRTPVREALKRLETDHLVVSYARRGTFATGVDVTELGAISQLRQQLEPFAAGLAAQNATPQLRVELVAAAREVRGLVLVDGDREGFIHADMAVHRLVYRATGNRHLEDVLVRYDNLATRIWCLVIDKLPAIADHVREHHSLLEAIAAGDAERAGSLALRHVESFDEAIRRVL